MDNLLDLNCNELTEYIKKFGHKPYRAKQLLKWIYHFGERDFSKMTDLAITFRESLKEMASVEIPVIELDHLSSDGTRKWLLDMGTKNGIETVFIPEKKSWHALYFIAGGLRTRVHILFYGQTGL